MNTDFHVWPFRFRFRAIDSVSFPPEKAGNILRGAFGGIFRRMACVPDCDDARTCGIAAECPYARIFEPRQEWTGHAGPSGLADWPRSFVFRAMHLDGTRVASNADFHFDLILFESPEKSLPYFILTFRELVAAGLGPTRGRAALTSVEQLSDGAPVFDGQRMRNAPIVPLRFDFAASAPLPGCEERASALRVRFLTPTELKSGGELIGRPEFGVLFRRLRDRISNLRAFYQGGPLAIDFEALAAQADRVTIAGGQLRLAGTERLSSRTGQRHPLGGFVGEVCYAGDLGPFIPYLDAGSWTGVGRQTVWGKGCFTLDRVKDDKFPFASTIDCEAN